ncbi:MAG TPA: ArgE/DapE family deacylase [Candidatus Limnocylindrales bacterium]|nr:ArgE/DapE family deacylase [Candidatus Limnocylindrales bacterium]
MSDEPRLGSGPPLGSAADSAARAASEAVDAEWLQRTLAELVRVPSVTGDEGAVQDAVAAVLEALGGIVERVETEPEAFARDDPDWPGAEMPRIRLPVVAGRFGQIGGRARTREGGRRILLVGHVDVVPVGDAGTWTHDPWGAEIVAGRLYGRGAVDMKGGLAAILGAVRAIRDAGLEDRLDGELVVVSVPSEEDGGQGMLAAIRAGYVGDAAVIAEPTELDVVIAHAGAITFRLTVPGRAAHASMRREGVSALDNLMTLVRSLEADEAARNAAERDPLMTALGLPYPTIIGKVGGGEWASTVIDQVVAEGRYGVRLGQTWQAAEVDLRRCIEAAARADPFLRDHPPSLELTGGRFSSARIPADDPLPVGLADAAAAVTGRRPAMLGEPYGADMRLLVNEGRTPTVMFGPGSVAVAHAADEFVPLDEVAAAARVLAGWLVRELWVAGAAG